MTFAAAILFAFYGLLAFGNWTLLVHWWCTRRSGSMILLVGGVAGLVGGLLVGRPTLGIVLLALDPGTFVFPIGGCLALIRHVRDRRVARLATARVIERRVNRSRERR